MLERLEQCIKPSEDILNFVQKFDHFSEILDLFNIHANFNIKNTECTPKYSQQKSHITPLFFATRETKYSEKNHCLIIYLKQLLDYFYERL